MKSILSILLPIFVFISCNQTAVRTIDERPVTTVAIDAKKSLEVNTPHLGPLALYTIRIDNLPKETTFYFSTSQLEKLQKLKTDSKGVLRCVDKDKTPFDLTLMPFFCCLPGQKVSLYIRSKDKTIRGMQTIIPYPLEAFGIDGAELSVERNDMQATQILCKGRYFEPNERLEIMLSASDGSCSQIVVCQNGEFNCLITTPKKNSYGSMVTLTLRRQNSELMTVEYPWGRETSNRSLYLANPMNLEKDSEEVKTKIMQYYKKEDRDLLV